MVDRLCDMEETGVRFPQWAPEFDRIPFMTHRNYVLERMKRLQEEERKRREAHQNVGSYDPAKMDCERMPWGCWILIALVLWAAFGLIMSMFQHHKPV